MSEESVLKNRRQHDLECAERLKEKEASIREWTGTQICIAKKEIVSALNLTKGKVAVILVILVLILGFSITSAVKSFSQNSDVEHNSKEIEAIKQEHKKFATDVSTIKEDVSNIEGYMKQQTQIMKALGNAHGIKVEIEK